MSRSSFNSSRKVVFEIFDLITFVSLRLSFCYRHLCSVLTQVISIKSVRIPLRCASRDSSSVGLWPRQSLGRPTVAVIVHMKKQGASRAALAWACGPAASDRRQAVDKDDPGVDVLSASEQTVKKRSFSDRGHPDSF